MPVKPAVSVVIPTYNGQHLLAKHLPSVAGVLKAGDEIIIVDDASSDNTVDWLAQQKTIYQKKNITIEIVSLPSNQRFAVAANRGVYAANNPYVLLLNNDVRPLSKDIRPRLLSWFSDKQVFAVGCAEVRSLDEDANIYGRGTGEFDRGLFMHWYDPDQNHHDTLWTAGGSMMVDRKKFLHLGGFDPLFYPAYEEDRDLSYQALKHGYQLIFDYQSLVWHQHESTNESVFGQRQISINSWKNQWLMAWKNINTASWWLQHLCWLPYHLTISAWKSRGASIIGWWRALRQLPKLITSRRRASRLWQLSDQQVFEQFSFAKSHRQ